LAADPKLGEGYKTVQALKSGPQWKNEKTAQAALDNARREWIQKNAKKSTILTVGMPEINA